ncbi:MAG: hypothetical protein DSO01_06475, partial [Archaeoglobi archaeon]
LEVEEACKSIEGFKGVKGRALAEKTERGIFVNCSNRGVNVTAMLSAIDEAQSLKGVKADGIVAVFSGSERATCEIIDTPRLGEELKKRDIDLIILSGALGRRLAELGIQGEFVENLSKNEVERLSARFNNPLILFFSNEA